VAEIEECAVCGECWWSGCKLSADYTLDVDLKRNGSPIFSGGVDLCAGHTRFAHSNGGRLNLKPVAIEQANALQKARA
jgi:hypothetical protein